MKELCTYRFDEICKDPAEDFPVTLDFYPMCVIEWSPNELYALNDLVRPRIPNGFALQANNAGTSGSREPRWPTTLGGVSVADGGITWTAVAAAANALNAISSPAAVSDPTGITIASVSVDETRKVLATYQGGTIGQTYDVVWTVTIASNTRVARQKVHVGKR